MRFLSGHGCDPQDTVSQNLMTPRRFPPPWQVEQTPGGFKVLDANGQALVYIYARETSNEANIAGVLRSMRRAAL
jgi:hypothetical protein